MEKINRNHFLLLQNKINSEKKYKIRQIDKKSDYIYAELKGTLYMYDSECDTLYKR